MAEALVGTIIGYLRLDNDQAMRALAELNAAVDKLDTERADVTVKADTRDAEVGLARVAAEVEEVDRENVKVSSSSQTAGRGLGAMATAALTIGPAIVPLAVGAAGLAAGFGALGAAGIAAFFGIKAEIESGSASGIAFTNAIDQAKGNITELGKVAASGILGPLQQSVAALDAAMPSLLNSFQGFGSIAGQIGANVVTGLISSFRALTPLMQDVGMYALNLSQRFSELMAGSGVAAFGSYVQSAFPQIMAAVESVAEAAIHLVQAFAGVGMGTIGILQMLANVINAIPTDVLAALAQLASSVFIAFRAWESLSGIVGRLGNALSLTAGAMSVMNIAAGGIGIALGVLSYMFTANAESQRQAQQATNDFAEALRQSNGVIDDSVRALAVKKLQDADVGQAAEQLGLSLETVTSAALGQKDALDQVSAAVDRARSSNPDQIYSAETAVSGAFNANKFASAVDAVSKAVEGGAQKERERAAAMGQSSGVEAAQAVSLHNLALLHDASAASTDADKKALQALNTEMDQSISSDLSLAQSQTAVDSALLQMTGTLKANKGSMDEHTQAGISDRRAIEGAAGALQQQRDAQIKAGESTVDATNKYAANGSQLLDTIAKLFGADSAAYKYAAQLLAIPKNVATAVSAPGADQSYNSVVNLAQALDNLHDRQIFITTTMTTINKMSDDSPINRVTNADGNILHAYASGGMENHVAQIAPAGAMRLWAEPETGGEAYIPLSPAKRARSLAIWEQTGEMLGATSHPSINNTFNMPPVDAHAVAAILEAKQAFQMAVA